MGRTLGRAIVLAAFSYGMGSPACRAAELGEEPLGLDQAITRTLERNPRISVDKLQVDAARGRLTTAEGQFDWIFNASGARSRVEAPYLDATTLALKKTDTAATSVVTGLGRTLENGVGVNFTQTYSTYKEQYYDPFQPLAELNWAMTVNIPILKFGSDYATATQRTAEENLGAARFSSAFAITQEVYTTAEAFWASLAGQQNIKTLDAIMERAGHTADILAERAKVGEMSQAEYQRSLAELRLREADVQDGIQAYYASRQQLAAQLGGNVGGRLVVAQGEFPEPPAESVIAGLSLERLVELALEHRLDRKSLERSAAAAGITLDKAETDLEPTLDLQLTGQYSAARTAYNSSQFLTLYDPGHRIGAGAGAILNFTLPLGNYAAEGAVTTSRASLDQFRMQLADLDNQIVANVAISLNKLRDTVKNYKRAVEARGMLEQVATDFMRKLSVGEATMTDVLSVESRLLDSRLRVISVEQNYADALVELRFATGTLAEGGDENLLFEARALRTYPDVH